MNGIRNIAGRVCYDIARQNVAYDGETPFMGSRNTTVLNMNNLLKKHYLNRIAQAVKLSVNLDALPHQKEIEFFDSDGVARKNHNWFRPFANHLWIDIQNPISVPKHNPYSLISYYIEPWDDGLVSQSMDHSYHLGEYKPAFTVTPFLSMKDRSYRSLCGSKWMTGFYGYTILHGLLNGKSRSKMLGFPGTNHDANKQDSYAQFTNEVLNDLVRIFYTVNVVSNAKLQRVPPANRVPKHEIKYPKLEYHVIEVKSTRGTHSPRLECQLRQSPRQHLRRGHLRRLPKGDVIWIAPMIVGDPDKGTIVKDYEVAV